MDILNNKVIIVNAAGQTIFDAAVEDVTTGRPFNPLENPDTTLTFFISSAKETIFFSLIEPRYRIKLAASVLLPSMLILLLIGILIGMPGTAGLIAILGIGLVIVIITKLKDKEKSVIKKSPVAQTLKLNRATVSPSTRDPYADKAIGLDKKTNTFLKWFFFPLYWLLVWSALSLALVLIGGSRLTVSQRETGMVVASLVAIPISVIIVQRIAQSKLMKKRRAPFIQTPRQ